MKFTCTRDNIVRALAATAHLSSKNVNLPILNHVFIQAKDGSVVFSTTNLEVAVTVTIRAKVDEVGSFTVPARTLFDYVNLNDSPQFELVVKDSVLHVIAGAGGDVKIKGVSAEEYPIIPVVESGTQVVVKGAVLKEALSSVVFAVASNEIRPELSGILFVVHPETKRLIFAATDSFRLAEKRISPLEAIAVTEEQRSIIPARSVFEMVRVLGVSGGSEDGKCTMVFAGNQFGLRCGDMQVVTRCIEGRYPDYTQIIPKNFGTTVVCPKEELMKKVKAAGIFTTSGMSAVTVEAKPEEKTLSMSSANAQVGDYASSFEVTVDGKPVKMVLNYRYFLDGLNNIGGEQVTVGMNTGDMPCVLRGNEKDEYVYIIMPIKQ